MSNLRERLRALDALEVPDVMAQARLIGPKPPQLEPPPTSRRVGALVLVAALALLAVLVGARVLSRPAQTPASTGPSVAPSTPDVDYLIDLNTGAKTPLPDAFTRSRSELGISFPGGYALSPDGSLLAYLDLDSDQNPQIFIARIDGTEVRQMTNGPMRRGELAWSPDGMRIAYVGGGGLFVLEVASGKSTQIADQRLVEGPQFMPGGSSILYTHATVPPVLKTVSIGGGKSTPLFPLGADLAGAENASLSPDGSLVTFLEQGPIGVGGDRWLANADGTKRRALPGCVLTPSGAWSPDGSRIVCSAAGSVIVVEVATGDVTRVGAAGDAIWLDDHTLLIFE